MEQTLGKRISENRKRLGMTQDGLAEKLGITAQAVSKWENDQSCPDITMLPKLAEIFGVTTDELLGREVPKQIAEAEIIPEENEPEGVHMQNKNWEFHWNSGKKNAVTFAMLVLWVGIVILAARYFNWDDSFWGILCPSVPLIYGIRGLLDGFSVYSIGMTLFGAYFLVDNLDIAKIDMHGEYIFPVMIVLIGIGLLTDALKKPRKPHFHISHNGRNVASGSEKTKSEFSTDGDCFCCSLSFGEKTHQINLPALAGGDASVSFGELRIDLTGCEAVRENCVVDANCSFGEMFLTVPRRFRVEPRSSTAFAEVEVKGHPDTETTGVIYLNANVSFGEIEIQYV